MKAESLRTLRLLLTPWLCACLCLVATAGHTEEQYPLLGHSTSAPLDIHPDREQNSWLKGRSSLRLGTSAPDYPPFDLTSSGRDYEGLTADYADILGKTLRLPVRVTRYADRGAAIRALIAGDIDMLGSANSYEASQPNVVLSAPYATDQPLLVTRNDETRSLDDGLAGLRLSMVYHYLPTRDVLAQYPKASLRTYPSFQSAINAVAFGEADVFLGDSISTRYLISKSLLDNLRIANFGKQEVRGFSFATLANQHALLGLINAALAAIPGSESAEINRRWAGLDQVLLDTDRVQLSPREERWLAASPQVRVLVNETDAPLTFFDSDGQLRGITIDLLELISARTGIRFDIQRGSSVSGMIDDLASGKADLISALTPSNEREDRLSFTRPYLLSSFVLVTRKTAGKAADLNALRGHRLAIVPGSPLVEELIRNYPDIVLVEANDALDCLELLAQGRVEGAVGTLLSANYLLAAHHFDDLRISSTLGSEQARTSLATARGSLELQSILNKALLSISPEELAAITSRWHGKPVQPVNYWHSYRQLVGKVVLGASVLLMLALAWNTWLRRQIRQREAAERALNDQLEFVSVMLNGTPHPLYVRDREGCLRLCNDSYLEVFAARREDVIGKTVLDGVIDNHHEALEYHADYQRVMLEGEPLLLDRALQIGTRQLTIYHWILPYRDSQGEVRGIIGGWIDISDRRQMVEELHAAKDRADDASRAKSTFLATMSHEIRTPMNAVIGMLELALKRADQGHLDRPAIEVAYSSANDLLELIGDILDIARIESGKLSLTPERANLLDLAEAVVRIFDGLARQKGLKLQLGHDPQANTDVLIDPQRFKQVLSNLVSNAIKFTEKGSVNVHLSVAPDTDKECLNMQLTVKDTGTGISLVDQERLFTPFVQASNQPRELVRGGAGLGLVICRNLCDMMGGHLALTSQPGAGTTVTVTLQLMPLAPLIREASQTHQELQPPATALNVLVVDDHPANRLLLCQQLAFIGHQYTATPDGAAGLKAWLNGCFDLVITDCNMPVMSGYALTTAIRQYEQSEQRSACVVIGFTANAQVEELQRCRDAGMDDCLFKPIGLAALGEHLAALLPLPLRPEQLMCEFFSLEGLSALTGGNPKLVQRLIDELLSSNQQDLEELDERARNGDHAGLANAAHKIKGAARIIKARQLIERCETLEQACEQAAPDATIAQCLRAIEDAMIQLEQALHKQQAVEAAQGAASISS